MAAHQTHARLPERCVLTHYLPLARGAPARNRKLLLERGWNRWAETVLSDLDVAITLPPPPQGRDRL